MIFALAGSCTLSLAGAAANRGAASADPCATPSMAFESLGASLAFTAFFSSPSVSSVTLSASSFPSLIATVKDTRSPKKELGMRMNEWLACCAPSDARTDLS